MHSIWNVFANSLASIAFGFTCFLWLRWLGNHRDKNRKIAQGRVTAWILQSIFLYTLVICLTGQWILGIPLSETIKSGFGDERAAWLLFGTSIDLAVRLYSLMDPE
jgi:hypothetical protein